MKAVFRFTFFAALLFVGLISMLFSPNAIALVYGESYYFYPLVYFCVFVHFVYLCGIMEVTARHRRITRIRNQLNELRFWKCGLKARGLQDEEGSESVIP